MAAALEIQQSEFSDSMQQTKEQQAKEPGMMYGTAAETAADAPPEWQESDWQQALSDLIQQPDGLDPQQRLDWLLAIRARVGPDSKLAGNTLTDKTLRLMAHVSGWLCDWPLQTHLLLSISPLSTIEQEQLAYAWWKQGNRQTALSLLASAMLEDPGQAFFYHDFQQLSAYSQQPPYYSPNATDIPLRLEPLAEHHLMEFRWQYSDPSIAELCNLPGFETDQQWLDWLAQQQALSDQFTFAVMHSEWGLIGVVSLVIEQRCGFFYYWLGKDFQGQGFGPQAVELLLEWGMHYCAIDCCYAKVYQHNLPSQKAIKKLGFEQLPFDAINTHKEEYFYYLGDAKPLADLGLNLAQLFEEMASDTEVDLPLAWKMGIVAAT